MLLLSDSDIFSEYNFQSNFKIQIHYCLITQVGAEVKNKFFDKFKSPLSECFHEMCCSFKSTLNLGHIKVSKSHVSLDELNNVNVFSERASKYPSKDQLCSLVLTPSF